MKQQNMKRLQIELDEKDYAILVRLSEERRIKQVQVIRELLREKDKVKKGGSGDKE